MAAAAAIAGRFVDVRKLYSSTRGGAYVWNQLKN